ncbi:MAG: Gingipain R, partial [Candidatus Cloacimonetes bacterium]|nr:Gingipain R [Candidatus Cloacimonadota bacterium]
MKKILLIFYVILISSMLVSINQTIDLDYTKTNTELVQSDNFGINVNFKFAEISSFDVNTKEGVFSQIAIPGYTHSTIIGEPKLPVLRKIISVPLEAEVEVTALDFEISEYSLEEFGIHYPIIPAQPPVAKSADPSKIEFMYNAEVYSVDNFTDNKLVSVEEIGIMRSVRLFILTFEPVKYNPVTGLIKVYNNVNVQVDFTGGNMSETVTLREKTFSPYFESIYSKSIFNYSPLESRDILTRYPVKYIIISDPMFEAQLQPFIEWKIEKGFEIIEAYTNDPGVGSTTTSIKNFIQTIYDAATPEDPAPSFILFVGDVSQIPAWNGTTGGHITDLNYARLEGTDYVPEMYYGRFSANNTTELQPQIDKTLEYERFEMPDPAFLGEVVMIAGMDASHGSTWGNGQINYGTTYYFNESHGIFSHTYLYPHSGSNAANIIQNVSDGVAYINYTAHGSPTSWADPSFTISNINGLQNEHEYCLAVGNCCSTNKFEVTTCFGEAWLRAENKGAIGYIGGNSSTYWDEDYWWGVGAGPILSNPTYEQTGLGVYDGLFHDHGEDFSDWTTTTGGMIYRGNLAVTEGGGMVNYYWEIYSIMGDPSLEAYLGVPAVNTATYPSVIFLGIETIQVTAEPYSYVALTMDGEIYGTALIDETGIVNLEFEAFTNPGIAKLVITRQNHEPVIEEIEVIPSEGPYVIVNSYEVHDDNNNIPEYNEIITLDVTFENVGIEIALNVNATLSTDDTYVNITSDYIEIGDIAAGEAVTIEDAFEIEVADNIPDQYMIIFDVEIVGSETWNSNINITFNAPAFEIGDMIINDSGGDGILDPGETATLSVPLTNIGHATSQDIFTQLINGTPDLIIIIEGSFDLTGLAP